MRSLSMPLAGALFLAALLLSGCQDRADDTGPATDVDGDGWTTSGGDCDDGDPSRHPGATDRIADGVDQDCDGGDSCWKDADGDGYGGRVVVRSDDLDCEDTGESARSTDCDDTRPDVHPDATEVCDDIDDDCDGLVDDEDGSVDLATAPTWYTDADGDGYGDAASSTSACDAPDGSASTDDDCDDTDPDVHPDATDTCEDGIDQDCSGADRTCGGLSGEIDPDADAATVIYSTEANGVLGGAFAVLDWDGDGQEDLALAASQSDLYTRDSGRVWVYLGPLSTGAQADVTGYEVALYGTTTTALVGGILDPVGDLDGDGDDELYVFSSTSSSSGRREQGLVLGGSVSGDVAVTSALLFNETCYGSAAGGDPDGDGVNGWVCGDGDSTLDWYEGTDTTPSMAITGSSLSGFGGDSVVDQDLDGDGVADLWIAAHQANVGGSDSGAVYLFSGPFASMTSDDADAYVYGTREYQYVGDSVQVADLDGDGTPDLLAGSGYDDTGATNAGAVWGWFGPLDAPSSVSDADVVVYGTDAGAYLGWHTPGVADLDDDGVEDLCFSSNSAPGDGTSRGEVWLFYGPLAGTLALGDAATDGAHLQGDADYDWLGNKTLLGSDLHGDGGVELIVGAHGAGWAGSATNGVLYVLDAR